ncbi:19220_t:CDS:2 [Funneliformis geosporum]|nr:19220_t:CDS:2 [Funneliformis geosporum]
MSIKNFNILSCFLILLFIINYGNAEQFVVNLGSISNPSTVNATLTDEITFILVDGALFAETVDKNSCQQPTSKVSSFNIKSETTTSVTITPKGIGQFYIIGLLDDKSCSLCEINVISKNNCAVINNNSGENDGQINCNTVEIEVILDQQFDHLTVNAILGDEIRFKKANLLDQAFLTETDEKTSCWPSSKPDACMVKY